MAEKVEKVAEPKYSKEQLIKSKRYNNKVDVITALLEDGKEYTLKQVDDCISTFNKAVFKEKED